MDPPAELQASVPAPASRVQSQAVAQDPGQEDYMTREEMECLNLILPCFLPFRSSLVCVLVHFIRLSVMGCNTYLG